MGDAVHRALERFARSSKLFSLLDEAGVERLAEAGTLRSYGRGDVVVVQGEVGTDFYLICAGQVRVSVEEAGGEVARLGPGNFFGEIAVITRQPRTATVECVEPSQLIHFEREPVVAILEEYPKVKEVLGGVGLMRSEENLQHVLGDGAVGLAEALEADATAVEPVDLEAPEPTEAEALPERVGGRAPVPLAADDDPTVIDPTVNDTWGGDDDTVIDPRPLGHEGTGTLAPLTEADPFGDAGPTGAGDDERE